MISKAFLRAILLFLEAMASQSVAVNVKESLQPVRHMPAQLALFDDVLSALDAGTYEHVFTHVFGAQGLLRQNGVTFVLAAHVQDLTSTDQIVVLENGIISEIGHLRELASTNQALSTGESSSQIAFNTTSNSTINNQSARSPEPQTLEDTADRKLGNINNFIYYLEPAGVKYMSLYFACLVIGAFCTQFPSKHFLYQVIFFLAC